MNDRPTADDVRFLILETAKVVAIVISAITFGYAGAVMAGCAW